MRVVLPGEADAAEHLDAVLGRLDRGVERDRAGDRRGERVLVGIAGRLGGVPRDARSPIRPGSSISAHRCLIAWKLPIGWPNCSRTFA